ncbi:MAG: hypothetical protein M3N08_05195 [Pseudomonadota bacterium]|nr:hypothetical protein [Pseudomonadota bacterium]
MRGLFVVVLLVLSVVCVHAAKADDTIGESLDWLVYTRPGISVAVVTNSTAADDASPLTIQTTLRQALKGKPPQEASFSRRWNPAATPGQEDTARPGNGTEYLLFFNDHGDVTNAVNLNYPSRKIGVGADPRDVAISVDFGIFRTREAILETVAARLDQIAKAAPGARAKGKQVKVPLDSPVWGALYEGNTCYVVVPDVVQDKTEHVAEFDGSAYVNECNAIAKKPFELKSAVSSQPHTMSISCSKSSTSDAPWTLQKLAITFKILDVAQQGDYEFRWAEDPDALPVRKGIFTQDKRRCEDTLAMLLTKIPHATLLAAAGADPNDKTLLARWRADCEPDDRWGIAMVFNLSIGPAPK